VRKLSNVLRALVLEEKCRWQSLYKQYEDNFLSEKKKNLGCPATTVYDKSIIQALINGKVIKADA
jgi:hypothetical protein